MIGAIRAEFRKLLTVRTTYGILLFAVLLVSGIAFFALGIHLSPAELKDPGNLSGDITGTIQTLAVLPAIVAILLMANEYRHNTIMYTLTSNNSRSKVLIAKILVVSVFALFFTLLIAALSPALSYLGVHAAGHTLVSQTIYFQDLFWRVLLYGWGYGMVGLLFAVLIRSQIGSIVSLFIIPNAVESLLYLVLKKNIVYLPFTALGQVLNPGGGIDGARLAPPKAALVFGGYLLVGWIVAWILFLRRDAN